MVYLSHTHTIFSSHLIGSKLLLFSFKPFSCSGRMEPRCITCDLGDSLWSSRRLYKNCTYFDAFVSPPSSIVTEYRVEYYVLECQGPALPVAGN